MYRRTVLLSAGVVISGGFAGCTGGNQGTAPTTTQTSSGTTESVGQSPTPIPPGEDAEPFDLSTNTEGEGFTQSGTVDLGKHQYAHLKLDPPERFQIDGRVTSEGPPFDFFVMRHQELERYASGQDFESVSEASRTGVTDATFEAELPSQVYRIVFDNSDRGEAPAVSEITVDVEWRVAPVGT